MRRFFLFFSLFLLAACVSLDSRVTIGADHIGNSVVDVDMTTVVSLTPELKDESSTNYMKKNLCDDKRFLEVIEEDWDEFMDKKCTSL